MQVAMNGSVPQSTRSRNPPPIPSRERFEFKIYCLSDTINKLMIAPAAEWLKRTNGQGETRCEREVFGGRGGGELGEDIKVWSPASQQEPTRQTHIPRPKNLHTKLNMMFDDNRSHGIIGVTISFVCLVYPSLSYIY